MDPLKEMRQVREELLAIVNGQMAVRQYRLDERTGATRPNVVRCELQQLEDIKKLVLKLGETT